METPSFQEDHISQVPALQLLQNLGYTYLRPQEVYLERKGKLSNVMLEGILAEQLKRLNKVRYRGQGAGFHGGWHPVGGPEPEGRGIRRVGADQRAGL